MGEPFDHLKSALADRCLLERELGAGGMASVFLAHDPRHNRKVAIKVMHPDLAALIGPERFLKEIETTANLQHPHIREICLTHVCRRGLEFEAREVLQGWQQGPYVGSIVELHEHRARQNQLALDFYH